LKLEESLFIIDSIVEGLRVMLVRVAVVPVLLVLNIVARFELDQAVNKKALELENEMKIEENMKLSQKKAKVDAKKKAEEAKVKAEAEKRRKAQELADHNSHKSNV
jgi:hypothetical protein